MKINKIIDETELDIEIKALSFDTREVKDGSLFFCLEGKRNDGHDFACVAQRLGAVAIVAKRQTASSLPHIIVDDTREALTKAAAKFFGNPHKKLKLIGITGTNGKTTTAYIVQSILQAAGKSVGLFGTNHIMINDKKFPTKLTTPDPIDFFETLAKMVKASVEFVVMEVSAHALALKKLEGVEFEVSAFTNFTQDHLDFFGTMDNYFEAKKVLFEKGRSKICVLNADDTRVSSLITKCTQKTISYGFHNPSDVFAINLSMSPNGLKYVINLHDDIAEIKFNLPGKFNMYNSLCAATICGALGISLPTIKQGIFDLKKVDGRFSMINTTKGNIIIDYAHTEDGLKNVLSTIREFSFGKVITVFGCGGDRDKDKRKGMGRAVSEHSDFTIITSDNPRGEDPLSIITEIASGINRDLLEKIALVTCRKAAIEQAIEKSRPGDVVLVAGKGSENFTEKKGKKIPYNDEEFVLQLLNSKGI